VALFSSTTFPLHKATLARDLRFGPVLLAAVCPLLFLHARYQPDIGLGVADARAELSDFAVAAVVVTAAVVGFRDGFGILRSAAPLLVPIAAFLALIVAGSLWPPFVEDAYPWRTHLVTALKFGEYALLTPAVLLLLRRPRDRVLFLSAFVLVSAAATIGGLLQFLGLVDEFEGRRPGQREPSFVGIHDFAALSGAALSIALIALALPRERPLGGRWCLLAGISGAAGAALSGALSGALGVALAAFALAVVALHRRQLTLRRGLAIAMVVATVFAGVVTIRAAALESVLEFLGLKNKTTETTQVESYAHRTVLAYIGFRIFLDHPVTGVGWQGSTDQFAYGPYLDDAHRKFPDVPARAFPSPEHPWGVQNAYIQALADLGVLGLALWLAVFAVGVWLGFNGGPIALVGAAWLLVAMNIWNGVGFFAGVPLAALTWLGCGLAAIRD
jgi:O-antigen ligase